MISWTTVTSEATKGFESWFRGLNFTAGPVLLPHFQSKYQPIFLKWPIITKANFGLCYLCFQVVKELQNLGLDGKQKETKKVVIIHKKRSRCWHYQVHKVCQSTLIFSSPQMSKSGNTTAWTRSSYRVTCMCLKRAAAGIFFSLQSSSTPKCQKDLCLGHDFNSGASYFLPRHLWEFVCQFRTLPPIGHFLLVHFRDHVQKRVSRSWGFFKHHWEICLSPFISTYFDAFQVPKGDQV